MRDFLLTQRAGAVPIARFRSQAVQQRHRRRCRRPAEPLDARLSSCPSSRTAQADGVIDPGLDPEAFVELLDIVYDGMGRRAASDAFQTSYERVGATLPPRSCSPGADHRPR